MSKSLVGLVLFIVLVIGILVFTLAADTEDGAEQTASSADAQVSQTFTSSEVAEHNTEGDCWTIIEDDVYDLTSFISRHPGGDEILRACGVDATTLFTERTTDDGEQVGSGTSHSSLAESQLGNLLIGELSE